MARTPDAPSSSRFSPFYCEKAVVTDVNRKTWTCAVETMHSGKTHRDLQWASPYHDYHGGAGIHFMPEVGTHCYVALPVDNTPAFVMCFIAPPAVISAEGDDPVRSTSSPEGSSTDVSYQSQRPDMNPGDIAMTTRDGNFIILRRGGILQLGATPLAQRIVVPVRNFVHDFFENYELAGPAGDVTWLVDRPELDPAGKAPCSWTFHLNEFATDKNATVRVRHLPLADAGKKKTAWEISVAANGIDRNTGKVSSPTYTMMVLTTGAVTEMIGADRSVEIKGDDTLTISGKQTTTVKGDSKLAAKNITLEASANATVVGKAVKLGDAMAIEPAILGNMFLTWLSSVIVIGPPGAGVISPASIAAFQSALSKKVFLK
jgi:hypothetical protein